jgi:hypothetical protein
MLDQRRALPLLGRVFWLGWIASKGDAFGGLEMVHKSTFGMTHGFQRVII